MTMSGTLNVWRDSAGTVVSVSFTERHRMHEWQKTVFDCGLTGLMMDWGAGGTVEARPVVQAEWARGLVDLWETEGWNTVATYLRERGFTV